MYHKEYEREYVRRGLICSDFALKFLNYTSGEEEY